MSARRLPVRLSADAQAEYDEILLYSLSNSDERVADEYRRLIDRLIDQLGDHPEIGRRRDELFPGCRMWPMGSHIAFYRITEVDVEVVRILHQHADSDTEF